MKRLLIVLTIIFSLSNCSNKETQTSNKLVGTWKMIYAEMIENDSLKTKDLINTSFIKIINHSHFSFFNQEKNSSKNFYSGAGTYTLNGSDYIETLNFTNVSTIDSIVVEAVHKNGTAPSAMTFSSATQTISALRTPVNNAGSTQGVYRATMNAANSITLSTTTPSNTWSFVAYVFRSNTGSGGSPSVGQYNEDYLYYGSTPETATYTLALPVSPSPLPFTKPKTADVGPGTSTISTDDFSPVDAEIIPNF